LRTPARRRFAAVLLPAAALLLASCGGGGSDKDAQDLLDRAFKQEIESADLKIDAELQLKGSQALDRPVRVQASGPFRGSDGKLPEVDLGLRINAGGGGQTVSTGFLSTGDRVFVKFQDVFYEQPRSEVERANKSLQERRGQRSSLKSLGLDPRSWLEEAKVDGETKVAGVETTHVTGKLDVAQVVRDFNEFVKRSGSAIGGATGQTPPRPLSDKDVDKVTEVVEDPSFDVYVGKEDDIVRRVSGRLNVEVPEEDRDSVGGIEGGSLEFSVEFADVNGDQKIEAPANARPLSDLTKSLGAGALGVLGGGSGGSSSPNGAPTPPSGNRQDAEKFKRYADCLDKARPEDTAALQRCAELLR
jgi:hypothetical protein